MDPRDPKDPGGLHRRPSNTTPQQLILQHTMQSIYHFHQEKLKGKHHQLSKERSQLTTSREREREREIRPVKAVTRPLTVLHRSSSHLDVTKVGSFCELDKQQLLYVSPGAMRKNSLPFAARACGGGLVPSMVREPRGRRILRSLMVLLL